MKRVLSFFLLLLCLTNASGARRLARGDGLFFCENANTYGKGNVWVNGHGRAFYWDNPGEDGFPLKVFPAAGLDMGILPFLDFGIATDVISYGFAIPGDLMFKTKITWPNNTKLRLFAGAFSMFYKINFLEDYPSIGGLRTKDVGFMAEGIMYGGKSMGFRLIGDLDLVRWKSFLPLKGYLNAGYLMSLNRDISDFDQITLSAGLEFKGLATDFLVEIHGEFLKGTTLTKGLLVRMSNGKVFRHHFSENPIYVSPGIRIKYENGLTLLAAVPLLLSKNKGLKIKDLIPDSHVLRYGAITNGYEPFYADWKIVGKMSYPIRFKVTTAEMIREFLLLKNRKQKQAIDIDEKRGAGSDGKMQEEDKKRLDEIRKRREEMMRENLLE